MAIRDDILKEYSKAYTVYLAEKIGPDQEAFDELLEASFRPRLSTHKQTSRKAGIRN